MWVTESEKAKQVKMQKIKNQLAVLDEKLPRPLEITISQCPAALAEVIDDKGTTRGDILEKKNDLRKQLNEEER